MNRKTFLSALFTLNTIIGYAQTAGYHWEVNGVEIPGATSVTFVSTVKPPSPDLEAKYQDVIYAGKLLHRYKGTHITGNLLQIGGVSLAMGNLIEMNRTGNPVSGYTPMYAVAGGLALAGYILNEWIAPGFITRAGLSLKGNAVAISLR